MFYNITTPDTFGQGDQMFAGVSAFDNYQYGSVTGNYDQEGIVTGSFDVTQTSAPCGSSNQWCAYFSICLGGSFDSYCTTGSNYFTTWEWALSPNTKYGEELTIVNHPNTVGSGYQIEYWGYLYSANGQVLQSFDFDQPSAYQTSYLIQDSVTYGTSTVIDFTDYEEIYTIGNSVDAWPAFNFYTAISLLNSTNSVITLLWTTPEYIGSGYPTSDGGANFYYTYSGGQNFVNINNMPFSVWVGNPFGGGLYSVTVTSSAGSSFWVSAEIEPIADPTSGSSVYYQANYCSLPCGDYSYSPTSSAIQPMSYADTPNAKMIISGTVPSAGTYTMSMYAWWSHDGGTTYLSYWTLTFTQ
jgi:hypothetical protein